MPARYRCLRDGVSCRNQTLTEKLMKIASSAMGSGLCPFAPDQMESLGLSFAVTARNQAPINGVIRKKIESRGKPCDQKDEE